MLSLAFFSDIFLFRDLVMHLFETPRWQSCCWCVPVFQYIAISGESGAGKTERADCPTSHLPGKGTACVLKPHESVFHIFYYIMFTNIELSFPPQWNSLFIGQIKTLIYLVLHISFVLSLQGVSAGSCKNNCFTVIPVKQSGHCRRRSSRWIPCWRHLATRVRPLMTIPVSWQSTWRLRIHCNYFPTPDR